MGIEPTATPSRTEHSTDELRPDKGGQAERGALPTALIPEKSLTDFIPQISKTQINKSMLYTSL